jgi:hypothetical protein
MEPGGGFPMTVGGLGSNDPCEVVSTAHPIPPGAPRGRSPVVVFPAEGLSRLRVELAWNF